MPNAARLLDEDVGRLDTELARRVELQIELLVLGGHPRIEHRLCHRQTLLPLAPTCGTIRHGLRHCQRHCAIIIRLWHDATQIRGAGRLVAWTLAVIRRIAWQRADELLRPL